MHEFARITAEQVFNTFDTTSPDHQSYLRMVDGGAAVGVRKDPIIVPMRDFGTSNRRGYSLSERYAVEGRIATCAFGTQFKALTQWGCSRVASSSTLPWPTDQLDGDLASMSLEHAQQYDNDGTYRRRRFTGGKVRRYSLSASNDQQIIMLALDAVFCQAQSDPDATAFPAATIDTMPAWSTHFTFQDAASGITLDGARTNVKAVSIEVTNFLEDDTFDEFAYRQRLPWRGRDVTATFDVLVKSSKDDRVKYEGVTAVSASIAFNNGSNTLTFNFNDANRIVAVGDVRQLGKEFRRTITIANELDTDATDDDLTITWA